MATDSSEESVRFEDVFQEQVIRAFTSSMEFKKFARSRNGLCLSEWQIQDAIENNSYTTDQKMAMLNEWRSNKGKDASVQGILDLVEKYKKEINPEETQEEVQLTGRLQSLAALDKVCPPNSTARDVIKPDSIENRLPEKSQALTAQKNTNERQLSPPAVPRGGYGNKLFGAPEVRMSKDEIRSRNGVTLWGAPKARMSEDEIRSRNGVTLWNESREPVVRKGKHPENLSARVENEVELLEKSQDSAASTSGTKANAIITFNRNDDYMYSLKPSTMKKKQMQKFPFGMCRFTAIQLDQHIYAVKRKEVFRLRYSVSTEEWNRVTNMRDDHGIDPSAVAFNGSVYVCASTDEISQSVERFEESDNTWVASPSLITARKNCCLVASKDHFYCIGGWDDEENELQSVERFDGKKWELIKQAPRKTAKASAALLEGWMYVLDNEGVLCYNIQSDSWSEIDLSPKISSVNKILNVYHKIYIFSGKGRMYYELLLLDLRTNETTSVGSLQKVFDLRSCLAVNI